MKDNWLNALGEYLIELFFYWNIDGYKKCDGKRNTQLMGYWTKRQMTVKKKKKERKRKKDKRKMYK